MAGVYERDKVPRLPATMTRIDWRERLHFIARQYNRGCREVLIRHDKAWGSPLLKTGANWRLTWWASQHGEEDDWQNLAHGPAAPDFLSDGEAWIASYGTGSRGLFGESLQT